jgi:hypothetical protein
LSRLDRLRPGALVLVSAAAIAYSALTDGGFLARAGLIAGFVPAGAAVVATRRRALSDVDQWACMGLVLFAVVWLVIGGRGGITWREAILAISALGWAGGYAVMRAAPNKGQRNGSVALVAVAIATATLAAVGLERRWPRFSLEFDGVHRLSGSFGYPNALGLFAALGLVLSLGVRKRQRWIGLAGAFTSVVVVVWSGSRGAWLAAGVGLVVLLVGGSAKRSWRVICGGVAIGAMLLVQAGLVDRITDTASSDDRSAEWSAAWRAGTRNLATGIGPEAPLVIHNFRGDAVAEFAHNEPLQVFAGGGLTAALALGAAFGAVGAALWTRRARLGFAVSAVFLVGGLVDFGWHFVAISAFAGMAAALDD